jgi:ABC-type bacteriocin/lantibiotic exporter with double-glycine peptidase domain
MYCGVNSMYALLRLLGAQVSYQEMEAELPVGPAGSTLKDMREVACRHGVAARVVRATPEQLWRCELPVIAHLEKNSTDDFDNQSRGHFVVLVQADSQFVRYIDGTSGFVKTTSADEFVRQWSGLLLVPAPSAWSSVYLAGAAAAVVVGGLLVARLLRRRFRRQAVPAGAVAQEPRALGTAAADASGPGLR